MISAAVVPTSPRTSLSIMDAIYQRRAVRDYTSYRLDEATIHALLFAAIQAPTAMHQEPWAFAILQDKALLDRLSQSACEIWREASAETVQIRKLHELIGRPGFNIFYNATTLIVICGKAAAEFVAADCWLAAQNLMLAAHGMGLGSCVIGLAVAALNTPQWKQELGIPEDYTAYAPILLGKPRDVTQPTPRKPPEVVAWRK